MGYVRVEVEVTRPLPAIALTAGQFGVAVLVRKHDEPVSFFLVPVPVGSELDAEALGALVASEAGLDLVRAAITDELAGDRIRPAPIDLTVAVCTRERPELLTVCLEALLRVRQESPCPFDVLVVDNAPSTPRTWEVVKELPDVRYVREPRPGLDFARNRAMDEVTTKMIAFVDDDAVIDRGWVRGLQTAWGHDPDAVAVTGLVLPYELDTEAQLIFERFGGFRRGFQRVRFAGSRIDRLSHYPMWAGRFGTGCNMAFRVEPVRQLGGFDHALDTGAPLPGGGDLDIFYRVVRAGYSLVYEPAALVFHRHRRELRALRRQYWTWGTSFLAFLHKTARADPDMKWAVRHTAASWLWGNVRELQRSVLGRSPLSPDLVLAQLAGGLLTFPWMYPWSRRRAQHISQQYGAG